MPSLPLREDQHRARAQRHRFIGDLLAEASDEWGAVPLFYSGYHMIKAAMLRDPIWEQVNALQTINQDLIPDDKYTDRHRGRRRTGGGAREWGVNELVQVLYPKASPSYERLHQGSIDVRYGIGLPFGALPALRDAMDRLEELDSSGELEAPILWPPEH